MHSHVYNWLVDFYAGRSHSTRFNGISSEQLNISANIIQGSAIGPASYVVSAADLTTVTAGNLISQIRRRYIYRDSGV